MKNEQPEYDLIRHLAARPEIYIGEKRLDYLRRFLDGFFTYKKQIANQCSNWHFDYNMQKWLFINELSSIAHGASLTAWELMRRCYGNSCEACDKFRSFIEETPYGGDEHYSLNDTAARHIYQIYSFFKWNTDSRKEDFNPAVSARYYPISPHVKSLVGIVDDSYETFLRHVQRMIIETYDDLWVYIKYERYFLQVRFLYHNPEKGWIDSVSLKEQEHYYLYLTILHAYAALMQKDEHHSCLIGIHCRKDQISIEVNNTRDCWDEVFNHKSDVRLCDKNLMSNMFLSWSTDKKRGAGLSAGCTGRV